ncbi:DUF4352 domain-containing protein [Phormidium nigroviride]
MSALFVFLFFGCLGAFFAGLINPSWVRVTTRGKVAKIYLSFAFIFLIFITITAPAPPPQSEIGSSPATPALTKINSPNVAVAKSQVYQIGQQVSIKDWELTAEAALKPGKTLQWSEFGNSETASGKWLVVPIALKNSSQDAKEVSHSNFQVVDAAGRTYQHWENFFTASMYVQYRKRQPLITPVKVVSGGTVRSFLIFDISPDAKGLKLRFRPASWQGEETLIELEK